MGIKNIAANMLIVILLSILVVLYFAFNNHFDGCPVPLNATVECEQRESNERKRRKNNAR